MDSMDLRSNKSFEILKNSTKEAKSSEKFDNLRSSRINESFNYIKTSGKNLMKRSMKFIMHLNYFWFEKVKKINKEKEVEKRSKRLQTTI